MMDSTIQPLLSHRQYPILEHVMGHKAVGLIKARQPNSIHEIGLVFPDFLESTSTWSQNHIIAFRMLDFNDLPISYLYPHTYYPPLDDPVIVEAAKLFNLSKDEIQHGNVNRFVTGAAFSFYRTLQDRLRTSQATPSPPRIPARPQRQSQVAVLHQHTLSGSSGSSYVPSMSSAETPSIIPTTEDKSESVTSFLLINYLYLLSDLENERRGASKGHRILFRLIHVLLL